VTLISDLLAEGEPEVEFHQGVAARMPRKRIASGALFRNAVGRILMVEPVYKPTWDIPGGVVDANETPLDACRREVLEELGIEIPLQRLLIVDWVPQQGVWHDALMFIFDGGILDEGQVNTLMLQAEELRAIHFTTLDDAAIHIRPSAYRRFAAALDVVNGDGCTTYLQFGRPVFSAQKEQPPLND
jgi:8-oxo-dGTP pyrophosphatase MutT (NUDIX family)